ncbi:universal stress protein [Haloparvum alkalitolerans]|uniref:universal stress protein n=1 Tax=Haloparvum alkalitolerans TaxID=1042953 RepID=UPI003CEA5BFE
MTHFVPFDGGELSRMALRRAATLGAATGEPVLAFAVIPKNNEAYARDRWLDEDEAYDRDRILERLRESVTSIAPNAAFDHEVVGKHAQSGRIATAIRERAEEAGASVVFIGSENAGHIVSSVADVGPTVAADDTYDVYIARSTAE